MKSKGTLYLVATPIGNLNEVSNRTIETLNNVDLIACEDTRNTKKLLTHFDIHKKLFSYHNYNESEASKKIIDYILEGNKVALVSDAGYPLISDPGFTLLSDAIKNNILINVISGPNAAVNAIVGSGLDTNHYLYYGFLNSKITQATKELEQIKDFPYTIIFYEAPHRINKTLEILLKVFGNRRICICKELTKIHEEYLRGNISDYIDKEFKGELVIVVEGKKDDELFVSDKMISDEINKMIKDGYKTNDVSKIISKKYKVSKKFVYNKYIENRRKLHD